MNEMHPSDPLHIDVNRMLNNAICKVSNTQMGQIVVNRNICILCT